MDLLGSILPWLQVIVAVLLVATILLQSSREGLGSAFGGDGSGFAYAKRGLEKQLFIATIVLAVIFFLLNILALFV
jgi:protein translocase SecG subunit